MPVEMFKVEPWSEYIIVQNTLDVSCKYVGFKYTDVSHVSGGKYIDKFKLISVFLLSLFYFAGSKYWIKWPLIFITI